MHANVADLARTFKLSLYGLAIFAALILGGAEGSWQPYGTLFLAVIGYWATESPGHFALGNVLSNVMGLIAVFAAGLEFFSDNPEGRLLAGTHLVIYATWIVFLQQSSVRKYWSICALSVLQVSVAAVLTKRSWYGGALIAFAVYSMWTLAVFSLYHIVEQYRALSMKSGAPVAVGGHRFENAVSEAGHEIQFDAYGRWISWRFLTGVALLSAMALLMSAAFYALTPRVWIGKRLTIGEASEEADFGRRNISGFNPQVKLGDLGMILESLEPVMMVHAYDVRYGGEHRLSAEELAECMGYDEPLFRGGILVHYHDGSWQTDNYHDSQHQLQLRPNRYDIRQEITLEPVVGDILFCFGTPVACEIRPNHHRASFNRLTGVLKQGQFLHEKRREVDYLLYTNLSRHHPDGIPRVEAAADSSRRQDFSMRQHLEQCSWLPDGSLSQLIELSQSLTRREASKLGRQPTAVEMARLLESYLRDSGEFRYSRNQTVADSSLDPVEDFLFNRKSGHCEYFATALALMLRAVDVPSRLLNGFKGGETSLLGQIQVQQRHAHTWVEAWDGEGSWLVLDPTPAAARAESVREVASADSLFERTREFFGRLWTDWVMNFTPERQRDDLYLPLKEYVQKFWRRPRRPPPKAPSSSTGCGDFSPILASGSVGADCCSAAPSPRAATESAKPIGR